MASIRERKSKSGRTQYFVQVRLKGYPPQYGTFVSKTKARQWVQQTEAAMREGRYFKTSEAKKHTLGELIDRYIRDILPHKKSGGIQKAQLLWWKGQIGSNLLADITPALIGEYRDLLRRGTTKRNTQRTPATVVRYMAALSHAFSVAVKEWGWLEDSPMRKVTKPREPRGRVRFLADDERVRLLGVCQKSSNQFLYPVVVLALSTGMRQGEIMNLKWSDIDLERGRVVLQETKNGERRMVPLKGFALDLLKRFNQVHRIGTFLLFPSKENPYQPMDLRFSWKKALKRAQIDDFRFHDLRHSCASYLAMGGASLAEIGEVLGHKTISMTKRYSHLSESHTENVVATMNERIFG